MGETLVHIVTTDGSEYRLTKHDHDGTTFVMGWARGPEAETWEPKGTMVVERWRESAVTA
jgi:hypothetical protein